MVNMVGISEHITNIEQGLRELSTLPFTSIKVIVQSYNGFNLSAGVENLNHCEIKQANPFKFIRENYSLCHRNRSFKWLLPFTI